MEPSHKTPDSPRRAQRMLAREDAPSRRRSPALAVPVGHLLLHLQARRGGSSTGDVDGAPGELQLRIRQVRARTPPLLATKTPTGNTNNLCVLVADSHKISIWSQSSGCSPVPARWGDRPEAVVMLDEQLWSSSLADAGDEVRLEWFAERSGVVLISAPGSRCLASGWISAPGRSSGGRPVRRP